MFSVASAGLVLFVACPAPGSGSTTTLPEAVLAVSCPVTAVRLADVMIWEIRNPDGGPTGLEVARARMGPHHHGRAHPRPEHVNVWVTDGEGRMLARELRLEHPDATPICRLDISGDSITRENVWPDESDIGKPVILPGDEVGILTEWWNADDRKEWRWTIDLSNSIRGRS